MIYFDGEEEKVKEFEIFAGDDDDIDIEIVSVKQSDEDDGIISFNPDEPEEPEIEKYVNKIIDCFLLLPWFITQYSDHKSRIQLQSS